MTDTKLTVENRLLARLLGEVDACFAPGRPWPGHGLGEAYRRRMAVDRDDDDPPATPDVPGQLPLFPGPDGGEPEGQTAVKPRCGVGPGGVPTADPDRPNDSWGIVGGRFPATPDPDPRSGGGNGGAP